MPPMQKILWVCEARHHHTLDIFTKAAWCEQERQFTSPSGSKCRPDITIYNVHRTPCVFIEIKHKNSRNKTRKVAKEIGAIWLRLTAPPPGSFQKELSLSRPWWELKNIPADVKREMDVLTQLVNKLFGPKDGTWANIDSLLNNDGSLATTTMQHSEPIIDNGKFPTMGGYIWVNECSLSCDEAQLENAIEEKQLRIDLRRQELLDLQQEFGRAVFNALCKAGSCPSEFTVPIDNMEIHTKVELTELTQIDGNRPAQIDLQALINKASGEIKQLETELDSLLKQRYPTIGTFHSS